MIFVVALTTFSVTRQNRLSNDFEHVPPAGLPKEFGATTPFFAQQYEPRDNDRASPFPCNNHRIVIIVIVMHIKQITISNFRSFREQGEVQPFSAGTNTVVGRNGSGKSILFDAVQFCLLAPRFAHLRQVRFFTANRTNCCVLFRRTVLALTSVPRFLFVNTGRTASSAP